MRFITPIILIVVSFALVLWYIIPGYSTIQSLRVQQSQYDQVITRVNADVQKQSDLLNAYNGLDKDNLARLEKLLPDASDNVGALVDLSDVVSSYGVQMTNIQAEGATGAGAAAGNSNVSSVQSSSSVGTNPYHTLNLSFSVTMPYQQFLSLLGSLESNLYLTDVSSIQFTAAAKDPYTYSLKLALYSLN